MLRQASADPSSVSPPGGIRRSRRVAFRLLLLLVSRLAHRRRRPVEMSQRLSGQVTCRGRVIRIVRSARGALQG